LISTFLFPQISLAVAPLEQC